MTALADANLGTTPVREGFAFDEAALARWLGDHVAGYAGPLRVEQFRGGQSNPTYKLITSHASYVLRRKPPGQILKGAHAIEREAQVLTALARADFPVARVHALCTDEAVIGTWFYVMEMVEGRIFWDAALPDLPASERAARRRAARHGRRSLPRLRAPPARAGGTRTWHSGRVRTCARANGRLPGSRRRSPAGWSVTRRSCRGRVAPSQVPVQIRTATMTTMNT